MRNDIVSVIAANRLKAEIFAEEQHDMVLKTIRDCTRVSSLVYLETVLYPVFIEDLMEFGGVHSEAVLVAHIQGDGLILSQIVDILIDKR